MDDDTTTFRQVISITSEQKRRSLASMLGAAIQSWQTFARQQFAKGGGKLFAYIARQDKESLSVDISKHTPNHPYDPIAFLQGETATWLGRWAPKGNISSEHFIAQANLNSLRITFCPAKDPWKNSMSLNGIKLSVIITETQKA